MRFRENLEQRARNLKAETFALYLTARDPRTPSYAKLFVAAIVAYALSPIDLIPDFVPILGYLDDPDIGAFRNRVSDKANPGPSSG